MQTVTLNNGILKAHFLSYGATLHQLWVPDRNGKATNVIAGLAKPLDYKRDSWYRGAVVGRFAGRLRKTITINDKMVDLEHEDGVVLHSGSTGWSKRTWTLESHSEGANAQVTWKLFCPTGSGGFPGNVTATVTYTLDENRLHVAYRAKTDAATPVNLTNHAYFNLSGQTAFKQQQLQINASQFLELGADLIPTGTFLDTQGTVLDFQKMKPIGSTRLDDYFVLNTDMPFATKLYAQDTGISMETQTDQPGVVIFTPPDFEAICFETQKFSNAPNISHFPETILQADKEYRQNTQFEFSVV